MNSQWYFRCPKLVEEIKATVKGSYPNLHLFIKNQSDAEIRGTFPVRSVAGSILDQFQITIRFPPSYPKELPEVREVGGRIPWMQDFHVSEEGVCCILLPENRWDDFPEDAPFKTYLDGPLHNFFLGQSLVALGEPWPFGEWGHGNKGILNFYAELLSTEDPKTIGRFLDILTKQNLKPHWNCPCGSGRKIRKCCQKKIVEFRRKVPPAIARKSMQKLGLVSTVTANS